MDSVEVSNLIDGLKTKRGKPVWYGNGQFSHWEKKDAQSGLPSLPQSNIPDHPPNVMAVAELPSGGPSDRGLPVDDGLPGSRTFAKPEDDIRKSDPKDEPIKRVDGPDNIPKDRDRVDTKEDNKNIGPPSYSPSESWDSTSKTPYPYRDDKSNTHNAMAIRVARRYEAPEVVAGMYLVASAPVLFLPGESKIAADLPEIEERLSPEIQTKGKACRASLKRADLKNLRWIFAVNCGNGPKVVRLKANRSGNVVQFPKLNLHLACSCPAWRWQGPEYHAKQQDYQDPNTPFQGTASAPNIRDPKRVHKVCKHVAAVLSMTRNWTLPARSGK
jgi:hypothetical protein